MINKINVKSKLTISLDTKKQNTSHDPKNITSLAQLKFGFEQVLVYLKITEGADSTDGIAQIKEINQMGYH